MATEQRGRSHCHPTPSHGVPIYRTDRLRQYIRNPARLPDQIAMRTPEQELRWLLETQEKMRTDLATSQNRIVNTQTGRTHHDDIRQGITDSVMEETLIRAESPDNGH